jgi:glycerol-3-phosphate dehydrogenase (NAD(P)+)
VLASTAKAVSQSGAVGRGTVAINASKGIEPHTMATMGDVIAREVPALRGQVWTLTGPSFAREVAAGIHTNLILGGRMNAKSKALAALFNGGCLRVSNWPDRVGVELGGSLKNVVAVGAGILDGLGAGANTKAALLVRGLGEMSQLIAACKGRADTVYGLSGLGDLIATGTSAQSRNRTFGEKLGQGLSPKQALAEIPTVVEGIEAAQSAVTLCRQHKVKAPLISAIHAATIGGHPRQVLAAMGFV